MKDYSELMLKCVGLLKLTGEAANKRQFVQAKNYAYELSMYAEQLDNAFDRHIIINEPDGSFTVNVNGGIVNVEDNVN